MLARPWDEMKGCPQAPQCHQGRSGSKATDNLNRTRFIYANVQPNLGRQAHQAGEGTYHRCETRQMRCFLATVETTTHEIPTCSVSTDVERRVGLLHPKEKQYSLKQVVQGSRQREADDLDIWPEGQEDWLIARHSKRQAC